VARPPSKRLKIVDALRAGREGQTVGELAASADCSYAYAELVVKQLGDAVQLDGKSSTGANRYRWVSDVERASARTRAGAAPAPARLPRLDDVLTVVEARRIAADAVEITLCRNGDGEVFRAVIEA
jgi:hypothetical protein